ncbi:forespore capture DNA-binding protein RefZ [Salicibibacter cibarius]|uniref:Forespore capture DNA-binding protein RefZ n=1 Tax=Salicibibacter cibarius TaxID=2743000 RepID=A0A7T7CCU4_9BACI|nr:forespore capture DNA-binding protein RefZ [Salicibibacter cibarius]QQK77327.1 forespore capture DNA-binding protein RefZ [Salicibibacter cibarius]
MAVNQGTKDKVAEAAIDLFMTKGYSGTSVRAIADRAGVNVALISYYFGGKKGMLENLINTYLEGYLKEIEEALEQTSGSFERLLAIIEAALQFQQTHHRMARLVLRELTLDSILVREVMASYYMKEKHLFRQVLEAGKKEGVFKGMRKEWAILHLRGMVTMPFLHAQHIREVFHLEPSDRTFLYHYMKHVRQFVEVQICEKQSSPPAMMMLS